MSAKFKIISETDKDEFTLKLEVAIQDNYKIAGDIQYKTIFNQKEQMIVHTYHVLLVKDSD